MNKNFFIQTLTITTEDWLEHFDKDLKITLTFLPAAVIASVDFINNSVYT